MNLHEALAIGVRDLGTKTVFGLLGDANLFFGHSLVTKAEIEYVAVAHEAGAVLAASGYSSTTGDVGVATVTHGPALSNVITPLFEAVRNSTPLVLLAGDTPLEDEWNLQDIPQEALLAPTGAGFIQVRDADQAIRALATAFRRASFERRPIVVNIPRDLQLAEVEYDGLRRMTNQQPSSRPPEESLDGAAGLLTWAKRPIVVAGHGAIDLESRTALVELATFLGAPLATTLKAKSLFKGEPLDIGLFGTLATDEGTELIAEADCVVAFGASLGRYTIDAGALLNGKRVIQCDVDGSVLGATTHVDEPLLGSAATTARALVAMLSAAEAKPSGWYSGGAGTTPIKTATTTVGDRRPDTVGLQEALDWIESNLPQERHLILDVGRFMLSALQTISVPEPRSYVHTAGVGSIGLGVANAIGAWKGRQDRPALVVTGDGGFMLGGLTEFNTAVRHGVDLIVFVMNDGAYGAEHVQFRHAGLDPAVTEMSWPELAGVADSLGGRGFTVCKPADFDGLEQAIEERRRPLLIDVRLDPDEEVPLAGH